MHARCKVLVVGGGHAGVEAAAAAARALGDGAEPVDADDDLGLELWSLETCAPVLRDAAGVVLNAGLVRVPVASVPLPLSA